jgi:mannitol-1-phosphate 5-dehydrogenase
MSKAKSAKDEYASALQPLRKLAKSDQLLGPTMMAREYHLARGIAAASLFDVKSDPQTVELIGKVGRVGIERAVAEFTGFSVDSDIAKSFLHTTRSRRRDIVGQHQ